MAKVLKANDTPALQRLDTIMLDYRAKAIVALVMAQREPAEAAELLTRARKLNWSLVFPYHLINKLTVPADK